MNIIDTDSNTLSIVEAMQHDEAYKLLGVPIAFSGDNEKQLELINTKAETSPKCFNK